MRKDVMYCIATPPFHWKESTAISLYLLLNRITSNQGNNRIIMVQDVYVTAFTEEHDGCICFTDIASAKLGLVTFASGISEWGAQTAGVSIAVLSLLYRTTHN